MNQIVPNESEQGAGKIRKSLSVLSGVRGLYFLPNDPFSEEVLIPGFQQSDNVDCMVGFFSSGALISIAPGLATYITSSGNSFRLIISPLLSQEDLGAIEVGLRSREEIADQALEHLVITEDKIKQHTLQCLSYLLSTNRIEIKVALMKDALFHPKVWLFYDTNENVMAAHGSSNVTYAGIEKNKEQVAVSKSWEDPNQKYVCEKLGGMFMELWENKDSDCVVIPLPEAFHQKLLRTYTSSVPPRESDLRDLYKRAAETVANAGNTFTVENTVREFKLPSNLRFEDGPFEHQGRAVAAWCDAGFRGVLEMATGSGKTITSMICAYRLFERQKPLLVVIAAPYRPLIEQWYDEVKPFGILPTNLTTLSGAKSRSAKLQDLRRRLRTGLSDVEVVLVSHDTLCTTDFLSAIERFDCKRLLIADEAHNLGSSSFLDNLPVFIEARLALSATPVRQYDQHGTDALFSFFGPVVFKFTLEEAIGRCLVPYEYFVNGVDLTDTEMDQWYELTELIKRNAWRTDRGEADEYLSNLLRKRRMLLEMAENKVPELDLLLSKENLSNLKHTLIYATDKGPSQLEEVNNVLRSKGVLYHQLTAAETSDRDKTKRIISSFQRGEIQVLTAKRVLDEGVNIPQIKKAYILASTTVERQWVQRRGRLLRTCSAINKTYSTIHDFLALPPRIEEGLDPDAKGLLKSELNRAQEFARLAKNAGRPDGPMASLSGVIDAAFA